MTDIEKALKERIRLYDEEARLVGKVSASYADYVQAVKDFGIAQKEINKLQAESNDLIEKQKNPNKRLTKIEEERLKILEDVLTKLNKQNELLGEAIKQTDKLKVVGKKLIASTVNGLASIPNLISNSFGKLKGTGLFEMDKAIKMSALQMGLLGKEGAEFSATMIRVVGSNAELGLSVKEMAELQSNFADNLGRTVMLSDKALVSMGRMSIATGLGAEGTADLAASMNGIGISVETTGEYIEKTMNDSHKMGLNASKVVKNIQGNMKMLNKYNFKDGVKGLGEMAKLATKLGLQMDFASSMSDKLWDVEGAVDMSAQLQVMGGEWAKMSDPFHLMFMARNDMKGLTEEITKASAASMHMGKDGGIEMSSMEMSRLKIIAKETNLEYDDLITAGKKLYTMNKVKQQIGLGIDDETKEFIANTAELDKNGKAIITVQGSSKLLSQLSTSDKTWLQNKAAESKSLQDRVAASKNFDDDVSNLIMQVKTYMLPIIDGINNTLGPILKGFMQDPDWQEDLADIGKQISEFIVGLKPVFTVVGNLVSMLGPTGTLIAIFGGKVLFNAAQWALNGLALGKGFLAIAKTGMGGTGVTPPFIGPQNKPGGGGFMGSMKKGFGPKAAIGAGIGGMAVDALTDSFTEKGTGMNIAGKALAGGLQGAAFGSMLGPWGTVGGAIIGSLYGGITAAMEKPDGAPTAIPTAPSVNDGFFPKPKNSHSMGRQIIQDGVATPIHNADMFVGKPGGPVMNGANKSANVPSTMKIEFSPLTFNGSIMVTSPGSPGQAIDLLKNQDFITNITSMIHVETQKQISGGKSKG